MATANLFFAFDGNPAMMAGQQGTVFLEYADNAGMSTNLVTVCSGTSATGGVLNVTNISTVALAGKWARLRTQNVTSTPTFTARAGQEVLQ